MFSLMLKLAEVKLNVNLENRKYLSQILAASLVKRSGLNGTGF